MSDTRTGGTKLALVLGAIIFVVSFIMLLWIGDYRFLAAFFLALLLAFLSAIVFYLAFGTGDGWSGNLDSGASSTDTSASAAKGAETGTGASSAAADDKAAETARREADAQAAAQAAEEAAARDAEAARKAAEARDAEVAAARDAEAEAARKAAEAEKAEASVASAAAAPVAPSGATDKGEDYDGDGIHEGVNEGTRPAGLDGPRGGVADDLKMIKGVGPKMEQLVNSLGFWHFDQLAAWTADEVAWVDANLKGFKGRVSRDQWVEQAGVLAAGGETEFSKRVEGGDVY